MSYQDTINQLKSRKKILDITVKSTIDNSEYKFQIRRMTPKEYSVITSGKTKNTLAGDLGVNYAIMEEIVCSCTVSPKIVNKSGEECGEQELSVNDLSLDIMNGLLYEIYVVSGVLERQEEEQKN